MGNIIDFFKGLFSKKPSMDMRVKSDSKNIKKIKKNRATIDNSQDNSFNNNGTIIDQSATSIYSENSKDLIVHARWNHLVPHKIEHVKNGIDCFNVLMPVEKSFLPAALEIHLENSSNKTNAVYVLLKRNSFIKNIHVKSITIKTDSNMVVVKEYRDLYGLLDKDQSFLIIHDGLCIGECIITIEFGFMIEKRSYKQEFTFIAKNDSKEFVMPKYQDAQDDIDWEHFSF